MSAAAGGSSDKGQGINASYKQAMPDSLPANSDTAEDREGGEEAVHDARVEKIYK